MGKTISRVKVSLTTLGITIISFSSKVMGLNWDAQQPLYANPPVNRSLKTFHLAEINTASKIAQFLLISLIFIVGIISFIKIRKIDDKTLKKKKIKKTIIIITILIILFVSLLLLPRFLKKY